MALFSVALFPVENNRSYPCVRGQARCWFRFISILALLLEERFSSAEALIFLSIAFIPRAPSFEGGDPRMWETHKNDATSLLQRLSLPPVIGAKRVACLSLLYRQGRSLLNARMVLGRVSSLFPGLGHSQGFLLCSFRVGPELLREKFGPSPMTRGLFQIKEVKCLWISWQWAEETIWEVEEIMICGRKS